MMIAAGWSILRLLIQSRVLHQSSCHRVSINSEPRIVWYWRLPSMETTDQRQHIPAQTAQIIRIEFVWSITCLNKCQSREEILGRCNSNRSGLLFLAHPRYWGADHWGPGKILVCLRRIWHKNESKNKSCRRHQQLKRGYRLDWRSWLIPFVQRLAFHNCNKINLSLSGIIFHQGTQSILSIRSSVPSWASSCLLLLQMLFWDILSKATKSSDSPWLLLFDFFLLFICAFSFLPFVLYFAFVFPINFFGESCFHPSRSIVSSSYGYFL